LIDEVRIYNRARTQAQIQADMNTPIGSPEHLLGEEIDAQGTVPLTEREIRPLFNEAINRWAAVTGMNEVAQRLRSVHVQVLDLPGTLLGIAATTVIFLDANGAGHGWFLDPTPKDNSEFASGVVDSPAADHVDLLTVLVHEMGHLLGLDDDSGADPYTGSVRADTLPVGVRRINLEDAQSAVTSLARGPSEAGLVILASGSQLQAETNVAGRASVPRWLFSSADQILLPLSTAVNACNSPVHSESSTKVESVVPPSAGPPKLVAKTNIAHAQRDVTSIDLLFANLDELWDERQVD